MDYCEIVRGLLVDESVGSNGSLTPAAEWSIHTNKLPPEPGSVIAIIASGGLAPNPKWLVDYPTVQILVRGKLNATATALSKAQEVKDALLGIPAQDVTDGRLVQINMIGDIASMGFDASNRPLYSCNFQLIALPEEGTNRQSL